MAQEIKNTFLKSKMNKDLDDRILPNGEYRDARNISVGRSEDNDVGALENIIGNNLLVGTNLPGNLSIIGVLPDNSTNRIYVFLTNYTDPNTSAPTDAPTDSLHYIYVYNNSSNDYGILVQGSFLNFSKTNRIIGINLIENLLFWTDNRNQPRKINVEVTGSTSSSRGNNPSYYTQEHQISVAKYSPYQAIKLYNSTTLVANLPAQGSGYTNSFFIDGDVRTQLASFVGATVVSSENQVTGDDFIIVDSIGYNPTFSQTIVNVKPDFLSPIVEGSYVTLIKSTMTNESDTANWPGDPDYLEDKFVRFSYRFKYDDNEYSLMAPFTQIAYIPKQKGYFLNGDEDAAYQSTVVSFMENLVQNVGLIIPLPTNANRLLTDYKITEIEILFRESDGIAVKVLESLEVGIISGASGINNTYTYEYQSRKPYKTLPEAQTVRVYDKVPVRAFAQESSGNRIIYGNYIDQYTPPANINYNCRINKKSVSGQYSNWIEYPNSSVKRNRNYQVGFILADKFGRQSPVILSSVDVGIVDTSGLFYFGSTIYSEYDLGVEDTEVKLWFGDAINLLLNAPILSTKNLALGTPGLYAIEQKASNSSADGYAVKAAGNVIINDTTYTFRLDDGPTEFPNNTNIPRVGDSMRGAYTDFVVVTAITGPTGLQGQYTVTTTGRVNDVYLRSESPISNQPDLKFAYIINDLGWYSYKIVVKQTEQEYYNVYLPGILNGYPGQSGNVGDQTGLPPTAAIPGGIDQGLFPTNETNITAFTVLFNDNINKIPRDLAEVGPDQKQYRSSVTLYGRVTNLMTVDPGPPNPPVSPYVQSKAFNAQYFPRIASKGKVAISHISTAIARANEVNMGFPSLSTDKLGNLSTTPPTAPPNTGALNGNKVFYQLDTNPLIARISTLDKAIGATALLGDPATAEPYNIPLYTANMVPYLAIYETKPVESLLDLYWESTSEGLIVDLNASILSGTPAATSFQGVNWEFTEVTPSNTIVTPGYFVPTDSSGNPIITLETSATLISQFNGLGAPVTLFTLVEGNNGDYALKFIPSGNGNQPLLFDSDSSIKDVYSFVIEVTVYNPNGDTVTNQIPLTGVEGGFGALKNLPPTVTGSPAIPDFTTTVDNPVLIAPFPSGPKWATAAPKNGTGNGNQGINVAQLQFRITSPPEDYPDNWEMNLITGELTQLVPGSPLPNGGTFAGNLPGFYTIQITVTDANGEVLVLPSDYEAKSVSFTTVITLGTTRVNPEALTQTCVINPASPSGGTQVVTSVTTDPINAVWYIAEGEDVFLNYGQFFPNNPVVIEKRIGTGGHTAGVILFSICGSQEGSNNANHSYKTGRFNLYYRIAGATAWQYLSRNLEYNQAGVIGNVTAQTPYYDWPEWGNVSNYLMTGDGFGINRFNNFVRAVDYIDLPNPNGETIEYLITMDGFGKQSGNTAYAWVTADDLNHPACLPWWQIGPLDTNGYPINAVDYRNGFESYKYYRSEESNTFPNPAQDTTIALYAQTPYGEYVNQFWTEEEMITPYVPTTTGTTSIKIRRDAGPTYPPAVWTTASGGNAGVFAWSVQYSSVDGLRLNNLTEEAGCKAGLINAGGGDGAQWWGTARLKS